MSSPPQRDDGWTIGGRPRDLILFLGRAADFLPLILVFAILLALALESLQDNVLAMVFLPLVVAIILAGLEKIVRDYI